MVVIPTAIKKKALQISLISHNLPMASEKRPSFYGFCLKRCGKYHGISSK
jgi:hypothetical protein